MTVMTVRLCKRELLPYHYAISVDVVILHFGKGFFPSGEQRIVNFQSLCSGNQRLESPPGQRNIQTGFLCIAVFIRIGVRDMIQTIFTRVQDAKVHVKSTAHQGIDRFSQLPVVHRPSVMEVIHLHQPGKYDNI